VRLRSEGKTVSGWSLVPLRPALREEVEGGFGEVEREDISVGRWERSGADGKTRFGLGWEWGLLF